MSVLKHGPTVIPQTYTCKGCTFLQSGSSGCANLPVYFCANRKTDNFLGYLEDITTPDWCEFLSEY
jgi:hypothetical protein